jgi:hypothetical protein
MLNIKLLIAFSSSALKNKELKMKKKTKAALTLIFFKQLSNQIQLLIEIKRGI